MCVVCTPMFRLSHVCLWSSHLQCLCLLWQDLVLVLLMRQSGATLGLSLVGADICLNCGHSDLQGTLPVLSTEWLSLAGRAHSQTRCLPPAHCWGHSRAGIYGYLLPTPGQELLWIRTGHCGGCLHNATFVVLLWAPAKLGGNGWVCGRTWVPGMLLASYIAYVLSFSKLQHQSPLHSFSFYVPKFLPLWSIYPYLCTFTTPCYPGSVNAFFEKFREKGKEIICLLSNL